MRSVNCKMHTHIHIHMYISIHMRVICTYIYLSMYMYMCMYLLTQVSLCDLLQNKGSDKSGWSFRKRSAGHRVLSNTVVTEIPSSENKISELVITSSEAPANSSISDKTSAKQWTEELPRVSTSTIKGSTVSNMVTKAADGDAIKYDSSSDETFIIVIQAAVRKFLAERELLRLKGVVKLQAAVRGHLVRCHAAGALRCIQSIVKMQALVRARQANLSVERSSLGKKGKQDSTTKPHPTYISIQKLLSNRFASQLLEYTPRTKPINIKCDPSKHDSAWKWLERWNSVSSPEVMEPHSRRKEQSKVNDMKSQGGKPMPPNCELTDVKLDFLSDENKCSSIGSQIAHTLSPEKSVAEAEQPKRPAKRVTTEQADSEGRKSGFGSRKASNPAFIAAHSRFEELTSKSISLRSVGSSNQDHVVDSPADNGLSNLQNSTPTSNIEPGEPLVYQSLRVGQTGGSECGTELSITSMLDSPDPSEVGNIEYDKEAKVIDKEAEDHALLGTELTHSISVFSEKYDGNIGGDSEHSKPDDNTDVSQPFEENASNADIELEPVTGRQVYKSNMHKKIETEMHHQVDKLSPEASPRSHITAPESQETPSSQISTNNKIRTDRKVSGQKPKSWSNSKKSPVSSSLRSSLENLPRDPKPGKRRNSFGSQSSDQIDQEPRDSSSSNSIPSYMQVTESARAKALANNSPKSSPDMQGKEAYMKKRHSLPAAVNGRHGSPRLKRSSPQAQQTTKGSDNRERKWQN
ncbi:protein IQ-DOMAIN 32-like isoform X2 [Cynara cardunculus var. scolymus]|uniref:protein IQ-DOMAIN 32-like isoform X2 n=1 Tax=Cynara cardunculus var. scolymus TaxID=59895 RepID=UPI000D626388|nr:protein IQ-DOMAIN 32-like isoform X2 [Cynara cardunculus var. scolymus]